MSEYRPNLDLTKPSDARRFFREYRAPDNNPVIEVFHFQKGWRCTLLMDDREVCETAIFLNQTQVVHGLGHFVPEEIH